MCSSESGEVANWAEIFIKATFLDQACKKRSTSSAKCIGVLEQIGMARSGIQDQLGVRCVARDDKAVLGRHHYVVDPVGDQHRHGELAEPRLG